MYERFSFVLSFFFQKPGTFRYESLCNYVKFMLNLNLFFVKICDVKMTTWTHT